MRGARANFRNSLRWPIRREARSEKVARAYKHFEIGIGEVSSFTMASFNPTQIFQSDVTEEKGENARLSAFVGAIAVGDLVKSTLGPKGMDKILQSAYVGRYYM